MNHKSLAATVLTAALGLSFAPQENATHRGIFHAHCIFASGEAALDYGNVDAIFDLLSRHADAHGWRWQLGGPQFVTGENAAACPNDILESAATPPDLHTTTGSIVPYRQLAQLLHQNGLSRQALKMLGDARELEDRMASEDSSGVHLAHKSALSEWAARIAAEIGAWEEALAFADDWSVTSDCSLGQVPQALGIAYFRVGCLVSGGRCDEALGYAKSLRDPPWWSIPTLIELLLDCETSSEGSSLDVALQKVLVGTPPSAVEYGKRARDLWLLAHASRYEQLERLEELAAAHPELAFLLLLSLDSTDMAKQLGAFDLVSGDFRAPNTARLLIDIGLPEVGRALEVTARTANSESEKLSLKYRVKEWEAANRRWLVLTGSER